MLNLTRTELEKYLIQGDRHMIETILGQLIFCPQPENISMIRNRQTVDYILWLNELVGKTEVPPAKEEAPAILAPPVSPVDQYVVPQPPMIITPGGSDVLSR